MSVDPNALPSIDRIGIFGPQAAALKARVDAVYAKLPAAPGISPSRRYVDAIVRVIGGHWNEKNTQPYVTRLANGGLRVEVIEDMALQVHPAAYWNAR